MTKKEIINELQKLGIDANFLQRKEELEKMLELAKIAINKSVPAVSTAHNTKKKYRAGVVLNLARS
jgi:hypothetical protein